MVKSHHFTSGLLKNSPSLVPSHGSHGSAPFLPLRGVKAALGVAAGLAAGSGQQKWDRNGAGLLAEIWSVMDFSRRDIEFVMSFLTLQGKL